MRSSSLSLEDVKYSVHLGCTADERAVPQEVRISVQVDFVKVPEACWSDKLEETLCYAAIDKNLDQVCKSKHFNTIEHLAQHCWNAITPLIASEDVMTLKVHKVNPPIGKNLKGSIFQFRGQK